MVEMESGGQEEISASTREKKAQLKQKQYGFEKNQIEESGKNPEESPKKSFKDYLSWIIIALVAIVLVFLIFAFDLV